MPRINLLPWREERRKLRQRQFNIIMGAVAAAGAFTVFLSWAAMDTAIANQNERNKFLTDQIAYEDNQIAKIKDLQDTKQRLLARMQIIEQLQASRPVEVHLFDQLVKTLPPGIYLTSITQDGNKLTLDGVAESSARVSTYLRNIDGSPWLGEPNLIVVRKDSSKSGSQGFTIVAKIEDKAAQQAQQDKTAQPAQKGTAGGAL